MDKKTGCVLAGCLITSAVVIAIFIVIGALGYSAYSTVKSYTAPTPMNIPVYKPTLEEEESVKSKITRLKQAIKQEKSITVVFTQNDINTIIATHKKAKELAGNFGVEIEGDVIKATGSLPLKKLNLPVFKDRYLNGRFSLNVNLDNGFLELYPVNIEVNGNPLPADFMKKLRKQNMAKDINNDPEKAEILSKFKNIEVKDNEVIVETKGNKEEN